MRHDTLDHRIQIIRATSASAISKPVFFFAPIELSRGFPMLPSSCESLASDTTLTQESGLRQHDEVFSSVKARLGRHAPHPEDTSSRLEGCRICTMPIKMQHVGFEPQPAAAAPICTLGLVLACVVNERAVDQRPVWDLLRASFVNPWQQISPNTIVPSRCSSARCGRISRNAPDSMTVAESRLKPSAVCAHTQVALCVPP